MFGTAFRRGLGALALSSLILAGLAGAAQAQQVQRIAAVVNDEVISIHDLAQRVRLVLLSSNLPITTEQQRRAAPQVLRLLIEERLQSQEAARLNIDATEQDMAEAVSSVETNNGIPAGRLADFAVANKLEVITIEEQLRVSIAWQKLLGRRIVPTVQIGNEEVDLILERIASSQGLIENRVAEILLPIDTPADAPEVGALAQSLVEQLRNGASFAAVARQFSKSASAARGGDIGWVQEGQLDAFTDEIVSSLRPGTISAPIPGPGGYRILFLIDQRQIASTGQEEVTIALRQLLISLAPDAPENVASQSLAIAREVASTARDCTEFAELAEAAGTPQPEEPSRLRMGDLNDQLRQLASTLAVNEASKPLRNDLGFQVVMICERDQEANNQVREAVRETLVRERVDMLSRRYLRDLRRAAFIDLRV
ncbi:MAG: peptidylprolyl isomerase [Alphaproteobacteria bacterium]